MKSEPFGCNGLQNVAAADAVFGVDKGVGIESEVGRKLSRVADDVVDVRGGLQPLVKSG